MKILQRLAAQETLTVESCTSRDGQGKLIYGSPMTIHGRVVPKVDVVRSRSGEAIRTVADVWVDAGEAALPAVDDRIITQDGLTGIVVSRYEGKALQQPTRLDHVKLKIREE